MGKSGTSSRARKGSKKGKHVDDVRISEGMIPEGWDETPEECQPVPEPSSGMAAGIALLSILVTQKKKRPDILTISRRFLQGGGY